MNLLNLCKSIYDLARHIRVGGEIIDGEVYHELVQVLESVISDNEELEKRIASYEELFARMLETNDNVGYAVGLELLAQDIENLFFTKIYKRNVDLNEARTEYSYRAYKKYYGYDSEINNKWFGKNKRGAFVTAITGNYDELIDPVVVEDDMDYICFSDSDVKSNVWKTRIIDFNCEYDNIRKARYCKIMTHKLLPDYDYCIWIDGKFRVIGDIKELIKRYSIDSPLLCFPHFERDCIYDEADACIGLKKGNIQEIIDQIKTYISEGYPAHNGLVDTGVMIKSLTDVGLNQLMELWWKEIENRSVRDQLSFNYVCNKLAFKYDLTDLFLYKNNYIETLKEH